MKDKSNILITGSSGFVGSNLMPYLEDKDYKVIGITRKVKHKNEISYKDLNENIWNSSQCIVHLAGKAHDLKKVSSDEEYYKVNRDLTINLFNQFLKSNCCLFIYVSSVKAVKDAIDEPLHEQHTPTPVSVYGKSKLEAEQYLLSKKIPSHKRLVILRPCMIHGPNNKGNLNLLHKVVGKGVPYPLGAYNNLRSFLSIGNFCFCIAKVIENKNIFGVYNIADDEALSSIDLIKIIGKASNKKAFIIKMPKFMVKILGRFGDVFRLPINTERIEKLTENYVVDNGKIKEDLKINNFPISAKKGLEITIKSF